VPAAQAVHGAQRGALGPALNVPLAHWLHTWSRVAVPALATNCPGAHGV
jgi:hypothetical protein